MPQMGESVTEGTILEWHVAEGEEVAEGDTVVEVSTDKVDAEVPAPASGVITKILAQPDDTVEVGQVLAQIDPNGDRRRQRRRPVAAARSRGRPGHGRRRGRRGPRRRRGRGRVLAARADRNAVPRPKPTTVLGRPGRPRTRSGGGRNVVVVAMPEMGESVTEGTVLEWHVAEGQTVAEGDTVIEVSTDKVDAEVPAPAGGTITKLLVERRRHRPGGPGAGGDDGGRPRTARAPADPAPAETRSRGAATAPARQPRRRATARPRRSPAGSPPPRASTSARSGLRAGRQGGQGGRARRRRRQRRRRRAAAVAAGEAKPLRGPAAMLAKAMNESRSVPTATSFRTLAGRHPRRQAQGDQRGAQGARDEGLLHPPDRLGDRQGGDASGR